MELSPEMKIKLAQVKADARAMGLKVRENWMDDAPENAVILAVGIGIGFAIAAVVL